MLLLQTFSVNAASSFVTFIGIAYLHCNVYHLHQAIDTGINQNVNTLHNLRSLGEVGGWLTDGVPSWQMLCHQNNQEEDNP